MTTARIVVAAAAFAMFACLLAGLTGCGNSEKQAAGDSLPPYPAELSAESSPTEVAQRLVGALDEGDDQALLGLVAVEHEVKAIDQIFRKHGKDHETSPADAAALTVSGWKATYAWCQPGQTRVTGETVNDGTAFVRAMGVNPSTSRPRELTIAMVREGGVWKVIAGIQSAEK